MPIVSVNIPVYNDEKYIGETLLSALNQTYRDLEIVVVDDGSTDRTAEIIKSFSDSRIKYYYQTNQGIGATRNKAIEHSSGKYIAFLDHDDLWMPNKLEKQLALFKANPKLGMVFCDTIFFNSEGDLYSIYAKRKPPRGMAFRELLRNYCLSCETVVVKRSVLDEVGYFPSDMMMVEEYDLFLRIASRYSLDYVNEPLAKYRIHEHNYSWGKENEAINEEKRVLERLNEFIPNFRQDYAREIFSKEINLQKRQGLLEWKNGHFHKARAIFTEIFRTTGSPRIVVYLLFSYLLNYEIFSRLVNWFFGKRLNLFE